MNRNRCRLCALVLLFACACAGIARAELSVHSCFQSGMVLQRGKAIPVRGRADAGETVAVKFADQTATAEADADGNWRATLEAMEAGGPHTLDVTAGEDALQLKNILVGDVWFCGGQSNMEWPVSRSVDAAKEVANADHPRIRLLLMGHRWHMREVDTFKERWSTCSPKNVRRLSGVAYFFARDIQARTDVPIGLVQCAWGGSHIQSWIPALALTDHPELGPVVEDLKTWTDERKEQEMARERQLYKEYGDWSKAAREAEARGEEPLPAPVYPAVLSRRNEPTMMYNGLAAPWADFPIRGFLWYQGESDTSEADQYPDLFRRLIAGWRAAWGDETLPFLYVQLANFTVRQTEPATDDDWAALRDAQATALALPATGMATAIDLGLGGDIHPPNKQEVGRRLALLARKLVYGEDVVATGPTFRQLEADKGALVVHFDSVGGGLTVRGETLAGFAIAGADGQYRWAEAAIAGDTVRLTHPDIPAPLSVRYAWAANPLGDLYNQDGLPAFPFKATPKPR